MKKEEIGIILEASELVNNKKDKWSFLTSIEYMLSSKLYVDSMYHDREKIRKYISSVNGKILDLGTGCGIFAVLMSQINKNIKVSAIDTYNNKSQLDPNFNDAVDQQNLIWDVLRKKYNIDFYHYDGITIPFPDNPFNIITMYAVIEHIDLEDLDKVLLEIWRTLKEGGIVVIFKSPRKFAYLEYLGGLLNLGRHDILYTKREMKNLFTQYGFDLVESWKSDMVPEFPVKFANLFYPFLKVLNFLMYYSPLRIFAHHNNFVLKKRNHRECRKERF